MNDTQLELVERLALLSTTKDLGDPEVWLDMAHQAEMAGDMEVASDFLHRALEVDLAK